MTPFDQILQVLDNNGELAYTDSEWRSRSRSVQTAILDLVSAGLATQRVDTFTDDEGQSFTVTTYAITDAGHERMEHLRNPDDE